MISSENSVGRATSATARVDALAHVGDAAGRDRCSDEPVHDALEDHHAPSTMMPKSTAPMESRFALMPRACR